MKRMLCVVDMQYPFVMAEDSCYVAEVVRAVRSAKSLGEHICIIEDRHGHSTVDAIREELGDYANVSYLSKSQWDGSLQIAIELLERLKAVPERITACGAFAEECVISTLAGLRDRYPAIELVVLRSACVPAPVRKFGPGDWLACSRRYGLVLS